MDSKSTPLVLSEGTKVVSRNPIAATQHLYPKGTVGVIVKSPSDSDHSYRIRLSDGFETQLRRDEFLLLSTVQESGLRGEPTALLDHELHQFVIFKCIVGSRAYGLENEESDTDMRGIYLPPADRHWSLFGVPDQLENPQTDEVYWELQKFVVLALKANPNILEVLHSPLVLHAEPIAQELLSMRSVFVSKLLYQTYNGYVLSQFRKMVRRRETGRPPKWKHAMHLIRLLLAGISTLADGVVPVRVEPRHVDRLLEIRTGSMSFDEIEQWRLSLHSAFEDAYQVTQLAERPDYQAANRFLLRARRWALETHP
jgi:hypothetical protein